MNDLHPKQNHANIEKRNRKIVWSILISIPTIIILIGLIAYIYQTANPVDITKDFLTYFNMPDERMVLNSGYEAQIISIEKERSKKPVVILTIAPYYVANGTSIPYDEAVYEWMCIPNEMKKEDLRKMGECVDAFVKSKGIEDACIYINFSCLSYGTVTYDQRMDTLWTPYRHEILKEMYAQYGTLSVSELKDIHQAGNFYEIHKEELESYLFPMSLFPMTENPKKILPTQPFCGNIVHRKSHFLNVKKITERRKRWQIIISYQQNVPFIKEKRRNMESYMT